MAKLMLLRQSGRPVSAEKAEAYEAEWKQLYDKVEKKAEAIYNKKSGKLQLVPSMVIMQRLLRYIERQLNLKYGSEEMIALPKSHKAWENLIKEHFDTPILMARRQDSGQIIAVIMDQLNS